MCPGLLPPCSYTTDKVKGLWNKDTLTHRSLVGTHPFQRELLGALATQDSEGHEPGNHYRGFNASSEIKTKTLDMKEMT